MIPSAWLLSSWIVVGAAVLIVHAVVLWQVARSPEPTSKWRWLALVPPVAPVVAWMGGRRVAPILWTALVVLYLVLRLFGG